ncbi:MAG: CCXG family PEP-CTERM protein [Colwellia sp.]|nr:CCXG family PEP-CTERM protein [Colwellia sp.]
MKLQHIKAVLLGLIFCAANASATLITLETRDINKYFNKADLLSSWNKSTASDVNSIDSFEMFKSGNDTLTMLTIDFTINYDGIWSFESGLDAGYGAALFVDDKLIANRTDNLWWRYNWNHSDVFKVEDIALTTGDHVIQLLWAENCCNGASSVRFTEKSGQERPLSVANVAAASIPEPTSIALFGLAALGLITRRKLAK